MLARIQAGFSNTSIISRDSLLRRAQSTARKGGPLSIKQPAPTAAPAEKNKKPAKSSPFILSAGLSAGKAFPLDGQQSSPYNVNGKASLLSDYIPAPYLRYYIGNRIYLETALHFNQPQYTKSRLIDSTGDSSRIPGWQQDIEIHSITLKKLYYTGIPLTFHYRVFGSLYLGAGLQFFRRWGGVAQQSVIMHPTNGIGGDSVFSTKVIRLNSNGSAYDKIRKDDWRILFTADYNWRRFTLGLRYQQGLSPYITTGIDGRPPGRDKNSSLGLFLQVDLWRRSRK
jgi:hypothetical protein